MPRCVTLLQPMGEGSPPPHNYEQEFDMSLQLSEKTILAALVLLSIEPAEGADPGEVLDDTLADFNLTRDSFMTEATMFACGYHRGLSVRSFNEDQIPTDGDKPSEPLSRALEDGYAYGLEARELALTPPPSLVFEAHQNEDVEWGGLVAWATALDLANSHRLGQAIEVGSGKDAFVVPAGTPIDVINDGFEKDGVPHVIVGYDGLAMLVPNPDDSPRIVTGDTQIAPEKRRRKRKAGAKKGKKAERGPTLKQAIIDVLEGKDGGPGPLQSNGAFAGRVMKRARELGIGDKAAKFVQKADKHVPYYINCYKPGKNDEPGRLGVDSPLAWVVAAIQGRKYYLRADGPQDERVAQIPEELIAAMEDRELVLATTAPPEKPTEKKGKKDKGEEAGAEA